MSRRFVILVPLVIFPSCEGNCSFARKQLRFFFLIAAAGCVAVFHSPPLTHYIESDSFRQAMEAGTAKGLHFGECHYSPIRRTSTFTAQSESYEARNGKKR